MPDIHGNVTGIRRTYIERLEDIYDMEMGRDEFCAAQMLEILAWFTEATRREAAVYVDRAGRILDVVVGASEKAALSSLRSRRSEQRLCGIRLIRARLGDDSKPTDADLQSLKTMRLDAVAIIGVHNGKATSLHVGIIDAESLEGELCVKLHGPFDVSSIPDDELFREILSVDARMRPDKFKQAEAEIARAILVGLDDRQQDDPLKELSQLADTAGFITVGSMTQPRLTPDKSFYLGHGKLQDLIYKIAQLRADTVIFDDELSPAQIRNIQKELGKTEILDRTSLILDIFSGRASTHEGRLQVELAQTKYMLPRLTGFWTHMSRMGGGGGGGGGARRGEGETQLEVDKRLLRKRLNELEKEIDKVQSRRDVRRSPRKQAGIPVVAIVGYTNAGKSTLLNHLSGSDVLSEDKLFATLDPVSRRVRFEFGEFILVDTVGFINKLPHDLVNAFRATLEETRYADLLLHVVDASSINAAKEIEVVNSVLHQLEADNKPTLMVYNKCDISGESITEKDAVSISAKTGMGMDGLKNAIGQKLSASRIAVSVLLPHEAGALVSRVYAGGQVNKCEYGEDGILLEAVVDIDDASRLRASAIKIVS